MSNFNSVNSIEFYNFEQWVLKHLNVQTVDLKQLKQYLAEIKIGYSDLHEYELKEKAEFPEDNIPWQYVHSAIDWEALKAGFNEKDIEIIEDAINSWGQEFQIFAGEIKSLKKSDAKEIKNQISKQIRCYTTRVTDENPAQNYEIEFKILAMSEITRPRLRLRREIQITERFLSSLARMQLEPIIVYPVSGKFEIIAGERRFMGLQQLRKESIECKIIKNISQMEADFLRVQENDYMDANPMEYADYFESLIAEYHCSQKYIAEKSGLSESYVSAILTVRADTSLSAKVRSEELTFSAARALLKEKHDNKKNPAGSLAPFEINTIAEKAKTYEMDVAGVKIEIEKVKDSHFSNGSMICPACKKHISKVYDDEKGKMVWPSNTKWVRIHNTEASALFGTKDDEEELGQ